MKEKGRLYVKPYWPLLGLHCCFHMIVGLLAICAGLIVIFHSEIISGLALVGAGSFATINSWQGFKEMPTITRRNRVMNIKENSP